MNHKQRLETLAMLGWHHDKTSGRHQVCAEQCDVIDGKIDGVEWSAYISQVSGKVYLMTEPIVAGEYDFTFDAFCSLARDGWPKPKVLMAARSLFGDDD